MEIVSKKLYRKKKIIIDEVLVQIIKHGIKNFTGSRVANV